ncbi:helix-turn-helix domain-containing protein [Microbacterium sp. NPDC089321]|uniref:AraC family transcriptional regulator n=1 Tax=Microbacterium sp. NPDC089321 TaxID=3155183 RepID=UPI0034434E04
MPAREQQGWRGLEGHRRYQHSPAAGDEVWISTFIRGTGLEVLEGDPRLLELKAIRFDDYLVGRVRAPAMRVLWGRTRQPAGSRYTVVFVNHGAVTVDCSAPTWASSEGGLCVVFPGTEPIEMHTEDGTEMIVFTFDRSEIAPHVLTNANMADIRPGMTVLRATYAYLSALVDEPRSSDAAEEQSEVLRALTRDVAVAFTRTAIVDDHYEGTLLLAQRRIDESSSDPGFGVERLAAACNVSRRTLDRVFEKNRLRVAEEIRRSRSRRAFALLTENRALGLKEVAEASGFGSITTMNRALRATYGVSAGGVRATRAVPFSTSDPAT